VLRFVFTDQCPSRTVPIEPSNVLVFIYLLVETNHPAAQVLAVSSCAAGPVEGRRIVRAHVSRRSCPSGSREERNSTSCLWAIRPPSRRASWCLCFAGGVGGVRVVGGCRHGTAVPIHTVQPGRPVACLGNGMGGAPRRRYHASVVPKVAYRTEREPSARRAGGALDELADLDPFRSPFDRVARSQS
jgi:hypothetical protein